MSEPAIFALIRGGKCRFHGDRWAAAFLFREILWGPDDLESWVSQLEELDEWSHDVAGGAVLDFDRKRLAWSGEHDFLQVPRVHAVYERLLKAAWKGFQVTSLEELIPLSKEAGVDFPDEDEEDEHARYDSVREAAGLHDDDEDDEDDEDDDDDDDDDEEGNDDDDDEEDNDDDEDGFLFGDEEVRAWVTVMDAERSVCHRYLSNLSSDLLDGQPDVLSELAKLRPAEIPREAVVSEGMWIDVPRKTVGIWGRQSIAVELPRLRAGWKEWKVTLADNGYNDQCAASGQAGIPMRDEEALARIVPIILSTKRFDPATLMGALGKRLNNSAKWAAGCLLLVICIPLVLFGLLSGMWNAVLITIAAAAALIGGFYLYGSYRVRKFVGTLEGPAPSHSAPPVAGPLDPALRRDRLERLLAAAGLPGLALVEPLLPDQSELDFLE